MFYKKTSFILIWKKKSSEEKHMQFFNIQNWVLCVVVYSNVEGKPRERMAV